MEKLPKATCSEHFTEQHTVDCVTGQKLQRQQAESPVVLDQPSSFAVVQAVFDQKAQCLQANPLVPSRCPSAVEGWPGSG